MKSNTTREPYPRSGTSQGDRKTTTLRDRIRPYSIRLESLISLHWWRTCFTREFGSRTYIGGVTRYGKGKFTVDCIKHKFNKYTNRMKGMTGQLSNSHHRHRLSKYIRVSLIVSQIIYTISTIWERHSEVQFDSEEVWACEKFFSSKLSLS